MTLVDTEAVLEFARQKYGSGFEGLYAVRDLRDLLEVVSVSTCAVAEPTVDPSWTPRGMPPGSPPQRQFRAALLLDDQGQEKNEDGEYPKYVACPECRDYQITEHLIIRKVYQYDDQDDIEEIIYTRENVHAEEFELDYYECINGHRFDELPGNWETEER